jgi:hypothetical protein
VDPGPPDGVLAVAPLDEGAGWRGGGVLLGEGRAAVVVPASVHSSAASNSKKPICFLRRDDCRRVPEASRMLRVNMGERPNSVCAVPYEGRVFGVRQKKEDRP